MTFTTSDVAALDGAGAGAEDRFTAVQYLLAGVAFFSAFSWGIEATIPYFVRVVVCPGVAIAYVMSRPSTSWLRHARFDPLIMTILLMLPLSTRLAGGDSAILLSALAVTGTGIACFVIASILPVRPLFVSFTVLLTALTAIVLLHALVSPGRAFAPAPGENESLGLRSIFWQKNSLGLTLVLGVASTRIIRRTHVRWFVTAVMLFAMVLARSSTALVAGAAVLIAQLIVIQIATGRRNGRQGVTFLILTTATAVFLILFALRDQIFGLLGKGSDLTGRDVIWSSTWRAAQDHLFIGRGFGLFWAEGSPERETIRRIVKWHVTSPHQGALEIITDVGLLGLALFALVYGVTCVRLARTVLSGQLGSVEVVSIGLVLAVLTTSLTEAALIVPGLPILCLINGAVMNARPVARREVYR